MSNSTDTTNDVELTTNEKKQIITKKLLTITLVAPIVLGILGMVIAYLITINLSSKAQKIGLIVGAFGGLATSIAFIFILQYWINKKIRKMKKAKQQDKIIKK